MSADLLGRVVLIEGIDIFPLPHERLRLLKQLADALRFDQSLKAADLWRLALRRRKKIRRTRNGRRRLGGLIGRQVRLCFGSGFLAFIRDCWMLLVLFELLVLSI